METEMDIYLFSINKWHLIGHQGSLSSLLSFAQYPKSKTHFFFFIAPNICPAVKTKMHVVQPPSEQTGK